MDKEKKKKINKSEVKGWIKVVCFIIIFMLILNALSTTLFSREFGSKYKNVYRMAYEYVDEKENSVDVVVIGDSNTYSSFCPMVLWRDYGYTSTVIASPRQSPNLSYSAFLEFLKKQNPKVLILETDALYLRYVGDAKIIEKEEFLNQLNLDNSNIISNTPQDLLTKKVVSKYPVFETHDSWKKARHNLSKKKSGYDDGIMHHGYLHRPEVVKVSGKGHMEYSDKYELMNQIDIKNIKRFKKICDEKGIKLVFYNAPATAAWTYPRHNGVQELANSLGVEYYDFNILDDYNLDYSKDFGDKGRHQNYNGAKKITQYLGNVIKQEVGKELIDKRNQPEFDYVEENANKFFEDVGDNKK